MTSMLSTIQALARRLHRDRGSAITPALRLTGITAVVAGLMLTSGCDSALGIIVYEPAPFASVQTVNGDTPADAGDAGPIAGDAGDAGGANDAGDAQSPDASEASADASDAADSGTETTPPPVENPIQISISVAPDFPGFSTQLTASITYDLPEAPTLKWSFTVAPDGVALADLVLSEDYVTNPKFVAIRGGTHEVQLEATWDTGERAVQTGSFDIPTVPLVFMNVSGDETSFFTSPSTFRSDGTKVKAIGQQLSSESSAWDWIERYDTELGVVTRAQYPTDGAPVLVYPADLGNRTASVHVATLTSDANIGTAQLVSVSPMGRRVAYANETNDALETIGVDGSQLRALKPGIVLDGLSPSAPFWLDETHVAWIELTPDAITYDMYIALDADGSSPVQVMKCIEDPNYAFITTAQIEAMKTGLVAVDNGQLWFFSSDGTGMYSCSKNSALNKLLYEPPANTEVFELAVSPDKTEALFVLQSTDDGTSSILRIDPLVGIAVELVAAGGARNSAPHYIAGGRQIVWTRRYPAEGHPEQTELWRMNVDGKRQTMIYQRTSSATRVQLASTIENRARCSNTVAGRPGHAWLGALGLAAVWLARRASRRPRRSTERSCLTQRRAGSIARPHWLSLLLVVFVSCTPTPPPPPDPQTTSSLTPLREDVVARRRALLVGVNDYKYDDDISDLGGTANDVDAMRDVLVRRFGFTESDLVVLKDKQATKANILKSFREHLIASAGADTIAVFYYSGHGSQMYDTSGDEPDSYDETIVAHDSGRSADHPNNDISDDEFNALLTDLGKKTRHTTVILDSCHSGSGVRAAGKVRSAPPDERGRPAEATAKGRKQDPSSRWRETATAYALISGARTDEFSYERAMSGKTMGALTWSLTRALWRAGKNDTYRDIMAGVQSEVSQSFPKQHPQLEGDSQDTVLFGMAELTSEPFLDISAEGEHLALRGGLVHGVTTGSRFDVFPPGTKDFTATKALARAKVTGVEPTSATLELEGGAAPSSIPAGARAVEVEHAADRVAMRVYIDAVASPELATIAKELGKYPALALVRQPVDYELSITRNDQREFVLEGGSPGAISAPIAAGPAATQQVVAAVIAWAKWHALANLKSDQSYTSKPLDVRLQLQTGARSVRAGTPLDVSVTNDSDSKLYLSLLDLGADGSIALVYPAAGAQEFIDPGNTWKKTVVPCTPKGTTTDVRDIVKVILTKEPHDLSFVTQPGLKRQATKALGGLEDLVTQVLTGDTTRGLSRAERETSSWATREQPLTIEPNQHPCSP